MKNFYELYAAGRVQRYHTRDVPGQSLGHHSWGVAMVVAAIYPRDMELPSRLLMAALTHDLAEVDTGDVPATAKWGDSKLTAALERLEGRFDEAHGIKWDLTPAEVRILKWADTYELCLYCHHHAYMGNSYANTILKAGMAYLTEKIGFPTTESKELYDEYIG